MIYIPHPGKGERSLTLGEKERDERNSGVLSLSKPRNFSRPLNYSIIFTFSLHILISPEVSNFSGGVNKSIILLANWRKRRALCQSVV